MFAATVAYALPNGLQTVVDRVADPVPNGNDGQDRIHLHLGARRSEVAAFGRRITDLAQRLAAEVAVLKVRLHLSEPCGNDDPAPPAPAVAHTVLPERRLVAILDLAFATPLERRRFYASDAFAAATNGLSEEVAHATAFG